MLDRITCLLFFIFCFSASLSAKAPINDNSNERGARKQLLYEEEPFRTQITQTNTVYVISEMFDLKGDIVELPEGATLRFMDGGGIEHGILKLSNGCKVVGGKFCFSPSDADMILYPGQKMNSPIVAIDASDITIEGTSFFYNAEPNTGIPCITVYGKERCCKNIKISHCEFNGTGIGVYSNVDGVRISENRFENSTQTLSVETLYDMRPYRHPKNVKFVNNSVSSSVPNLTYPIFWLSGVEGLEIGNNQIATASDAIMLYCGDGNIAMDKVTIRKNTFELSKRGPDDTIWKHCIIVRGKSFPYQKEGVNFGNSITVSNNEFISQENCTETHNTKNRAISITWCNDITVKNNRATGFSSFVVIADVYKGYHESATNISISNNKVIDTYDKPILILEEISSCSVKRNRLVNCNVMDDVTRPLKELKSSVLSRNRIQSK